MGIDDLVEPRSNLTSRLDLDQATSRWRRRTGPWRTWTPIRICEQ